jgi:very-short-patch-repair endonuclease
MSDDVRKLNELDDVTVSLKPRRKKNEDKKYLLVEAMLKYGQHLPKWKSEFEFCKPERRFRFDIAWPRYHIAVEEDGGGWMVGGGRHGGDGDKTKMNLSVIYGWRVMHFSPTMLKKDPIGCVAMISRALRRYP